MAQKISSLGTRIVPSAFLFSATDDAPAGERGAMLRNHRPLHLVLPGSPGIDHHPILHAPDRVRASRVGIEGGAIPWPMSGMEHGQPSFVRGIEAFGRDLRQLIRAGLLAILAVDLKKKVDRRPLVPIGQSRPYPSEHIGDCSPDRCSAARAAPWNRGEASIMGGVLQLLENLELTGLVKPTGQGRADPGYGAEKLQWPNLGPETLEILPFSRAAAPTPRGRSKAPQPEWRRAPPVRLRPRSALHRG